MPIRLIAALLLFFGSAPKLTGSPVSPAWPGAEWTRSTPEAQGMSSVELAAMLERIAGDNPGIRSVTVIRYGTVVLDIRIPPFSRGDRHDIHSCTKSVLSMLVGIAIENGDLPGVDTPVLSFFPDYEPTDSETNKRAITLRHLLTMSAGLKTEDSYLHNWVGLGRMRASRDWAKYVLDLPVVTAPGTAFEYSNGVSELIAIILQKATGQSAADYARERLFEPVGIIDDTWQGSRPDDSWGYSGLSLHPLDMARLGYLCLRGGEWDGEQVIPATWVHSSTSPQIAAGTLAESYGYQWWVDDDMYMMQGYGGQFVYVVPDRDLVVVFTGALPHHRFFTPRNLLRDYIEPAVVADVALSANPTATTRLDSLSRHVGGETRETPEPAPALAQDVSGRTYEFARNKMGIRDLTLHFSPGSSEASLVFVVGAAAASLTIGLDEVFRISDLYGQRWACRGRWTNVDTFVIEQEAIGKVLRRRITFNFRGETLNFEVQDKITGLIEHFSATMAGAPPAAK